MDTFSLAYPPPIIAPSGLLEEFCTTGTHVCYTGILETHKSYENFYRSRIESKEAVILDHSPGTNRIAPKNIEIGKWISILEPRVVVLPDFNYQCSRTIRESLSLLREIENLDISTIGVLQGANIEELKTCYEAFKDIVTVIGLPAGLEKIASRNRIVYNLEITEPCVFIEVYKRLSRERPEHPNVELMWSGLPLRLAYDGQVFSNVRSNIPDLDFSSDYVPEHATINIGNYISLLTGKLSVYEGLR